MESVRPQDIKSHPAWSLCEVETVTQSDLAPPYCTPGRRDVGEHTRILGPGRALPSAAMPDDCTFCAIVAGRLPAHVVLDDEVAMAFLDVRPLFPGHTLVVPREHHVTLTDLIGGQVEALFTRVRRVTQAVERGMGAAGSFVALNNVVSQSVPHLHVHVVPRNRKDGLRGFFWPRTRYAGEDEAAAVASTLRATLAEIDAAIATGAGTGTGTSAGIGSAGVEGASTNPAAASASGQGTSPQG